MEGPSRLRMIWNWSIYIYGKTSTVRFDANLYEFPAVLSLGTQLGRLPLRFRIGDNLILDVPRNFAADYQNTTHFSLVRKLSQDEDGGMNTDTHKSN